MFRLILVLFLTMFATLAAADEVYLSNGDRLTGQIKRLSGNTLILETDYAGKIEIDRRRISQVSSDQPLYIELSGKQIRARLTALPDGTMALPPGDETSERVSLSQVTTLSDLPPDPLADRFHYKGNANASLSSSSGNAPTDRFYFDAELVARNPLNRISLGAQSRFGRKEDSETENNTTLSAKYDRFFTKKWYGYVNSTFTRDRFRDLELRTAAGAGSGYQIWESNQKNLSIEGGLTHVNENFTNSSNHSYAAARWGVKLDYWLYRRFAQLFHSHEGLLGLEDTDDLIIRSKTGLRMPLGKGFSASAQLNWDWDRSPAPDTRNSDRTWLLNLGYTFD